MPHGSECRWSRGLRPECWDPPALEGGGDEGSSRGEAMASEEGGKPRGQDLLKAM